jgi:DIS3-like exonuclease 2
MSGKKKPFGNNDKSKGGDPAQFFKDQRPRAGSKSNSGGGSSKSRGGGDFYEGHLDEETVNETGTYLTGRIRVNPRKKTEAYVSCDGISVDIRVDDEKLRNRSLDGDLVALEILPEDQWLEFSAMLKGKLNLGDEEEETAAAEIVASNEVTLEDTEAVRKTQQRLWRPMVNLAEKNQAVAAAAAAAAQEKEEGDAGATGKSELEEKSLRLKLQPRGKVVCILEAKKVEGLVGGLQLQSPLSCGKGEALPHSVQSLYFVPMDPKYPNLFVPRASFPEQLTSDPYSAMEQIYVADLSDYWSPRSRLPQGVNLRPVGQSGSIEAETQALLLMNNCAHGAFTEEVLGPLREKLRGAAAGGRSGGGGEEGNGDNMDVNWQIPEEEIARRRDLRGHRIFTIDPPNAKDLDDALHITPLHTGTGTGTGSPAKFEVGVHIADVSYFIERDSALDAEAKKRATSVYLVQKVVPMLPAVLCEQLCSLNPNVDRLAFSCIWQMNADGSLVEGIQPWFGRTVIRSCAKLDYPTAQRMIDGTILSTPSSSSSSSCAAGAEAGSGEEEEDAFLTGLSEDIWETWRRPPKQLPDGSAGHKAWKCARDVCYMHSVARNRREARLRNGSLVLTNCKLTFRLDASTGDPAGVGTYAIRQSNQLVEEYMLLANYLVAQELLLVFDAHAFIRSHAQPDTNGMKELQSVVKMLPGDHELDTSSSKTVQESLNSITRDSAPLVVKIITNMLTKPIPEAQYRRSGEDPTMWEHYALAIPYYTHFTSPIRRYADVVVHRLLEAAIQVRRLGGGGGGGGESTQSTAAAASAAASAAAAAAAAAVGEIMSDIKGETNTRDLDQTAAHCNEMKRASKAAQMRSDRVYLAVYLTTDHAGPQVVSGYVIGIGAKSFTVFVPEYGVDDRLFVDNMPCVSSDYDDAARTLTLIRTPQAGTAPQGRAAERPDSLTFEGAIKLRLLSPVRVLLSSKAAAPVDVVMSLIDVDEGGSIHAA